MLKTSDHANPTQILNVHQDICSLYSYLEKLQDNVTNEWPTMKGIGLLQVKNHALLSYTKMELFFMLLKLQFPEQIKDHPVITQLVRYRTLLERIRPMDRKMKYQVDKMLKIASSGENAIESLQYGPKPDQLLVDDAEMDGQESDEKEDKVKTKPGIYRAPRLAAMHYEEEKELARRQKQNEKNRKRMEKSQILSELREEFSEQPLEIQNSASTALDKEIAKEEAEKKEFEESRFVRLVATRKEKARKRQRERAAIQADAMGTIENFSRVQDVLDLNGTKTTQALVNPKKSIGKKIGGIFAHLSDEVTASQSKKAGNRQGRSDFRHNKSSNVVLKKKHAESAPNAAEKRGTKKQKVVFTNIF